jgi:hypothetical protein
MVVPGATQTLSTFCLLSRTQNFMIVNIIKKRRISICSILQPWESLSGYQYSNHWWCAGAALHLSSFWDWVEGEHLCTSSGSFMDFNRRWGHCCNQQYARKGKTQDHSAISEELPESNQFLYQICCLWLQINWTAEHKDIELSVYISCILCCDWFNCNLIDADEFYKSRIIILLLLQKFSGIQKPALFWFWFSSILQDINLEHQFLLALLSSLQLLPYRSFSTFRFQFQWCFCNFYTHSAPSF